jgi:hypothetical protein
MATQSDEDIRTVSREISRLLEELPLRAFVFTFEPKDDLWQLRVECAMNGAWQVITIPLERAVLSARMRDPSERERLKADLRDKLRECAGSDMP